MSNIYVKWNKLRNVSGNLSSCERAIGDCARQVSRTRQALQISTGVDPEIKRALAAEYEEILKLQRAMASYAAALVTVADLYQHTEEENINR